MPHDTMTTDMFRDYQLGDTEAIAHLSPAQHKLVDDYIVMVDEMQRGTALTSVVQDDDAVLAHVRIVATLNMHSVVNAVNCLGDTDADEIANPSIMDDRRLLAVFVIAVEMDRIGLSVDGMAPLSAFRDAIDARFGNNAHIGLERLLAMQTLAGDLTIVQQLSSAITTTMIIMVEANNA